MLLQASNRILMLYLTILCLSDLDLWMADNRMANLLQFVSMAMSTLGPPYLLVRHWMLLAQKVLSHMRNSSNYEHRQEWTHQTTKLHSF